MRLMADRRGQQATHVFNHCITRLQLQNQIYIPQKCVATRILEAAPRPRRRKRLARWPTNHDIHHIRSTEAGHHAYGCCVIFPDITNQTHIRPIRGNRAAAGFVYLTRQQRMNTRLFEPQIQSHRPREKRQGFDRRQR